MTLAVLAPLARRELLEATRWIARDNPRAANGLRTAVRDAAARIGRHPEIGRHRPDLVHRAYRFLPLTDYPYVLVYEGDRRPPLIVRVLHGARDLGEALEAG